MFLLHQIALCSTATYSNINQINCFIQYRNILLSFTQEHREVLKSNSLNKNKLYYMRQDYSKNEKKLKSSLKQIDNVKEDISLCKQEIIDTDNETFRLYSECVLEEGGLVSDQIEHQRLCVQRETRTKLFNFGEHLASYVQSNRQQGKSKIRLFFERVFSGLSKGKEQQFQNKLNDDINSLLFGDVLDFRLEVADVLKNIEGKLSSDAPEKKSSIKAMSRQRAH